MCHLGEKLIIYTVQHGYEYDPFASPSNSCCGSEVIVVRANFAATSVVWTCRTLFVMKRALSEATWQSY